MNNSGRDFVKLGALAGPGAITLTGTGSCIRRNQETVSSFKNDNQPVILAGLSLEQLHELLKDELFKQPPGKGVKTKSENHNTDNRQNFTEKK